MAGQVASRRCRSRPSACTSCGRRRQPLLPPHVRHGAQQGDQRRGVAITTLRRRRSRTGRDRPSSAASSSGSPGTNITTNSGAGWKCRQYALAASASTWARNARAWAASSAARRRSSGHRPPPGRPRTAPWRRPGSAAPGQPDDHVRPHAGGLRVGGPRADLGVEVAVLDHAGQLDDPLQLHLAPPAADLRSAQRPGQRAGVPVQVRRRPVQRGHLLAQPGVGRGPLALHLVQVLLHPAHRVRGGRQQRVQLPGVRTIGAGMRTADQHADRDAGDQQQRPEEQVREVHAGDDARPLRQCRCDATGSSRLGVTRSAIGRSRSPGREEVRTL